MFSERKRHYRRSDEITGELIAKRFNIGQLLVLVGQEPFENYQNQILERLQRVNSLSLDNFRKVHSGKDCQITPVDTAQKLLVGGIDMDIGRWSDRIPIQRLTCQKHGVVSIEFINYGQVYEGPFMPWNKV